jgi:hypothetical protein
MPRARTLVALLALAGAGAARGQTMLDQEQRLIEIHSLLLDLPPVQAPVALLPGQLGVSLEIVGIPHIDGTTGSKRQITASDRTPLFPRPRISLGLPAPRDFRSFVGVSYIPPFAINGVSTNSIAIEGGFGWTPGPAALALRGHYVHATSRSPVTDPDTRDTLETSEGGVDLGFGWRFDLDPVSVTPYAGVGLVSLAGRFTVTSDGYVLHSDYTGVALQAGLRVLMMKHWQVVGEVDAYPGRLVHASLSLGYVFDLWSP